MAGKIFLIPNTLGGETWKDILPQGIIPIISDCKYYLVENIRTARRFLKKLKPDILIDELEFYVLDKHTGPEELKKFLEIVKAGHSMGVISEAGCPGVADPGSDLVMLAHRQNIRVVPLVGPSSILLSIMASGFNGQSFSFHGYLPIKKADRQKAIKQLERDVEKTRSTQIFIEAPYRNQAMFEDILMICKPGTQLCIAKNITLSKEYIKTRTIEDWKKHVIDLHKHEVIFLLGT